MLEKSVRKKTPPERTALLFSKWLFSITMTLESLAYKMPPEPIFNEKWATLNGITNKFVIYIYV